MKRSKAIQAAVDRANYFLANSPDEETSAREHIAHFLSALLMDSKSYKGFNHIYWSKQGYEEWVAAGKPDFPEKDRSIYGPSGDKTRIFFY